MSDYSNNETLQLLTHAALFPCVLSADLMITICNSWMCTVVGQTQLEQVRWPCPSSDRNVQMKLSSVHGFVYEEFPMLSGLPSPYHSAALVTQACRCKRLPGQHTFAGYSAKPRVISYLVLRQAAAPEPKIPLVRAQVINPWGMLQESL